ncbi:Crp/Fnr family transcriptional regulator [Phosphitispora fastidiosa]|uniref:Crp/Fnr family transcriptional regulator n=1 Tax=Phosphitispora fastidiosa TaxID=2837202 RepID=UPI001E3E4EA4|nr:Crp/Fnr family transcriptional regulator [Phosphitispora fastidiosa]MBU7008373.1 CRP/FNR family transcriptional regulator [Phosphitispora fastidiosa]
MNDYSQFLGKIPLFRDLSSEELKEISRLAKVRNYKKNMLIFLEGEPGEALFFVISGKVKISMMTEDGREQILHILQHGDVFAEVVLIDRGPYPASAEVIETGQIGMLMNDDLENYLRTNPDLALKVLRLMSKRLRLAQIQVRDLALKDTYGRLASMLLMLAKDHGEDGPSGITIDLPLGRQELANLIGTTRETVTRILGDFKKNKCIELDKQAITIIDEAKLKTWL